MKIFNKLNSSLGSKLLRETKDSLRHAEVACFQLASVKRRSIQARLGLKDSAQILLDIIKVAQNSRFYRAACNHVADQAFQLLNAVDGGVQGRAIDVNNILRDYIYRLNQDFLSIQKILTGFTSRWSFTRFWAASAEIQKCHDLVEYGMAMYLLLVRCSIARGQQRIALRRQYNQAVAHYLRQMPSFNYSIRSIGLPLQKSNARPNPTVHQTSGPQWMKPQYRQQVPQRVVVTP